MIVKRGEIWVADLNPIRGSEQAGTRPVLIFQNNLINKYTTTILAIPLTTNLRRASLPSCVQISKGEGGLASDSVALCH
jgi:mRNA interferase MazF